MRILRRSGYRVARSLPQKGAGRREVTLHRFEYLLARRDARDHAVLAGYACGSGDAVYLEEQDREVHTYVCGVSGSGKSRFLENLLLQDIRKGHPLCLIDPTGYLYRKA